MATIEINSEFLGHVMVIMATPYGNFDGAFIIQFMERATNKQALHFKAKFDPDYVVVRRAMNDDLR